MSPPPAAIDLPHYFLTGISPDILIRLALAALAGGLLGVERERHGRAAGLRTTLLVCLASCIAMIISDGIYVQSFADLTGPAGWHPDPARLAAGVLSGMGFLGAGVIVRQSSHLIRGVTTAATLWFVTIIGLAFGAGAIGIGLVATVLSLLILMLIPHAEAMIENDWYSDLEVAFSADACSLDRIVEALLPLGVKVKSVDFEEDLGANLCRATFHLKYKKRGIVAFADSLTAAVRSLPGVRGIALKS